MFEFKCHLGFTVLCSVSRIFKISSKTILSVRNYEHSREKVNLNTHYLLDWNLRLWSDFYLKCTINHFYAQQKILCVNESNTPVLFRSRRRGRYAVVWKRAERRATSIKRWWNYTRRNLIQRLRNRWKKKKVEEEIEILAIALRYIRRIGALGLQQLYTPIHGSRQCSIWREGGSSLTSFSKYCELHHTTHPTSISEISLVV